MYSFIQKIIVLSQHWSKEHFLINTYIILMTTSENTCTGTYSEGENLDSDVT